MTASFIYTASSDAALISSYPCTSPVSALAHLFNAREPNLAMPGKPLFDYNDNQTQSQEKAHSSLTC